MKVYISGPIFDNPDEYREQFDAAAQTVSDAGHIPLNPAMLPLGLTPGDYMRIDLAMLDAADMVVLLTEGKCSDGAQLEAGYADHVKVPTLTLEEFKNKYGPVHLEQKPQLTYDDTVPGYKGFLLVRCQECGEIKPFCAKTPLRFYRCDSCRELTELNDLIPAYVECPNCGDRFRYKTNIKTSEPIEMHCLRCQSPVDIQINSRGTALVTVKDGRR